MGWPTMFLFLCHCRLWLSGCTSFCKSQCSEYGWWIRVLSIDLTPTPGCLAVATITGVERLGNDSPLQSPTYVMLAPRILAWQAAFGNFIPFAVLTYGVNQSVAWAIGGFAIRFYMKEPRLGIETVDPYRSKSTVLLGPAGLCGPLPQKPHPEAVGNHGAFYPNRNPKALNSEPQA